MSSLPHPANLNQNGITALPMTSELLVADAVNWAAQLIAPSALVAGGLLTTMTFGFAKADLEKDSRRVIFQKQLIRVLLLSAFSFEVMSVFGACATITNVLHSGYAIAKGFEGSAIQMLRMKFEVEFLVTGVGFYQGLLNWLAAIWCSLLLPEKNHVLRKTNHFLASCLASTMVIMVSMINRRTLAYDGYIGALRRCLVLMWERMFHIDKWRLRPAGLVLLPILASVVLFGSQILWAYIRGEPSSES